MMENNNNVLALVNNFEGTNVGIITDENGNVLFEIYTTGMALGYVKSNTVKGKTYLQCRKDRVDKTIENAGIKPLVHNGLTYLNEEMLYDFMLEARTDKCKPFRKWVTSEVLPAINHNGGYIIDNASEEQINKLTKYSLPKLKNTFKTENIELIHNTYQDVKEFYKYKVRDTDFRVKVMKNIEQGLKDRIEIYSGDSKYLALITICDDLIKIIKEDKESLRLKISGGRMAYKTRIINNQGKLINEKNEELSKLENAIAILNPSLSEYMVLDTHPLSENYMYETVVSDYTGKNIMVKTNTYNNWIRNFPSHQLLNKEDLNIDWNIPIVVFLKYDCLDRFDLQNFTKSILDQVITRDYLEDDKIVDKVILERNKTVKSYGDGKIYICIRNVD